MNILNVRQRMWALELLGGTRYPYAAVPGVVMADEWWKHSIVYRLASNWKPPKDSYR